MSYSVLDYVSMIGDPVRTGAYVRALRKMVTPDSVVLDLGAGFGFFAVLAAKLGARHAFAIDPNDAISLGPALARANGVGDRVTFYHGDARQVTLPERANLLIEDLRGVLPLHEERIKVLCDARERLLTADARRVALRDHLFAAPSELPVPVRDDLGVLLGDPYGVDLRSMRIQVLDAMRRSKRKSARLLLPRASLGTLDLATATDPYFEGTARWRSSTAIVVDGLTVWFDAELAEDEGFSAAPGPDQTAHGCLYLSLREPLMVPADAELSLRFNAIQAGGEYLWSWECALADAHGRRLQRTPRQSTLASLTVSRSRLAAMSEIHRPIVGLGGRRLRDAIALADGARSSREIARALAASAELAFADDAAAFDWLQRSMPLLESGEAVQL